MACSRHTETGGRSVPPGTPGRLFHVSKEVRELQASESGDRALSHGLTMADTRQDISTAWLLLSHGPLIGAALAASALSVAIVIFAVSAVETTQRNGVLVPLLDLALGWHIGSTLITLWVIYAISTTWQTEHRYPMRQRIFGDFGFATLLFITLFLGGVNVVAARVTMQLRRRAAWLGWTQGPWPRGWVESAEEDDPPDFAGRPFRRLRSDT